MRTSHKVVLMGLLAISAVIAPSAGCAPPSASPTPFVSDRVVTVRIVMTEEDWTACQLDALAERYVMADFWFDGELIPDVAIRPKGNSSLNQVFRSGSPRLSLKVDFNFFNSARTFRGLKKVNLNNGFNDPTFIRETLAYEVFAQMGIPTPRTAFVDLWVNDTHLGLYTMVEQVDKSFLARHFPRNDGNLYKPEMPAAYLNWTEAELEEQHARLGGTEPNNEELAEQINMGGAKLIEIIEAFQQAKEPAGTAAFALSRANAPERARGDYLQQAGLKTNEPFADHSALLHFLDVLNTEPDDSFPEEIEKVLDVDEALRFIAVAGTVGYFDSYLGMGHNYYLYEVDGYFTIIPWDLNGAFGAFTGGMSRQNIINLYIDEPTAGPLAQRPLVDRLLSHQPYVDTYHRYLEMLLDGPFSAAAMSARIDQLADLIRPYVEADGLKFYSTADFERGLSQDIQRGGMTAGQPPAGTPLPPAQLSPQSLACLRREFDPRTLQELRTRRPTAEEMAKLESCLTPTEMAAFLEPPPGPIPRPVPLSATALDCLGSKFDQATLEELRTRRPTPRELADLRSCLPREEVTAFLRSPTPGGVRQPGQPAPGRTFIGLKTFVAERGTSIREQLEGKRPSFGDGSGNGGSMPFDRQGGRPLGPAGEREPASKGEPQ